MSKFNNNTKNNHKTVNKEGSIDYIMDNEMELYTLVCTSVMQNMTYERSTDTLKRLCSLVKKVSPLFVAKLAVYARTQMYLRTVPLILIVELAKVHSGDDLVSKTISKVVNRADEITELLSCYQALNNRTETKKLNKLSNQIKKGIKLIFESDKFDEYQYSKYNRGTTVKLRDAIFLTHPDPRNKEQRILFKKIIDNELETAYTWETQMSEAGKEDSKGTTKKKVWEDMIDSKKMGYMATLRNLRNILKNDVSGDHIKKVCDYISNPVSVLNSKQLPFRFLSAYRMLTGTNPMYSFYNDENTETITSVHLPKVLNALELAIQESIHNIPMFDNENVLIGTDVSGSMQTPVSQNSVVSMFDVGTVLAMMLHNKCKQSITGMFGDTWKPVNFPKNDILRNANEIHNREGEVGYSTNGYKVIQWDNKSKIKFDKIMMFTDCQLWGRGDISHEWSKYIKNNPDCKLYIFDLNGYGSTPLDIQNNNVNLISGWSDKIFDVLNSIENGDKTLDMINSVEIY